MVLIDHAILTAHINMKLFEFINTPAPDFIDMIKKLLPIAMKELGISKLPRIILQKEIGDNEQPTFGCYVQGENVLFLALNNRHPVDVLRTLSHELVHFKQDQNNELDDNSGETGSDAENEAHAIAGVIMRHLNKAHPEFLRAENIELP